MSEVLLYTPFKSSKVYPSRSRADWAPCVRERISIEVMTSDRELKASREGAN